MLILLNASFFDLILYNGYIPSEFNFVLFVLVPYKMNIFGTKMKIGVTAMPRGCTRMKIK